MDDFRKIKIGLNETGIIGLETVLAEIDRMGAVLVDDQIGSFMREKLAKKLYPHNGQRSLRTSVSS